MNEKIFITLGSQKFQFNRLLIAVDKLCEKKVISGEDVFAQTGYSDYVPRNYSYNNFLDSMAYQVLIMVLPLITAPYLSRVVGAEGTGIYSYTYFIP